MRKLYTGCCKNGRKRKGIHCKNSICFAGRPAKKGGFMCQSIFRNEEETKRREAFTRLFVSLAERELQPAGMKKEEAWPVGAAVRREDKVAAS